MDPEHCFSPKLLSSKPLLFSVHSSLKSHEIHAAGSACGDANVELHSTLCAEAVPGHPGAAGHQPQRDGKSG